MNKKTKILFLSIMSIISAHVVSASQTVTWTGGGNDTNFSNTNNWDSGNVPIKGDLVSFPTGGEFNNDLTEFYPSQLVFSNNVRWTTFKGNSIGVEDSGLLFIIRGQASERTFRFEKSFVGTGTLTVCNESNTFNSGLELKPDPENELTFSGKWVLDRAYLSTGIGITLNRSQDAVTLKNGASLKNNGTNLVVESQTGVVLGDGGGGFCCGWDSDFSVQVDGPISGTGSLLIASCYAPVYLNCTTNTYTGETVIGTFDNVAALKINASQETRLVMGADYAIPRNNDVIVDGDCHGVLELDGHTLELGTLKLINGGILRNSSETPVTIKADTIVFGGWIEGPITLDCTHKELAGSRDDFVPESGHYVTIGSGETNRLSGMGLGGTALKLNGGVLSLPLRNGFAESAYSGYRCLNDTKEITAFKSGAEMGNSSWNSWGTRCGYYYQTLWQLNESASYHFYGFFDDSVALQIDRDLILNNNLGQGREPQFANRYLSKGWHEVRIWFANDQGQAGPVEGWDSGVKWSSGDEQISQNTGNAFSNGQGTFVFTPSLIRPLYVGPSGGEVKRSPEDNYTGEFPDLLLLGGLIATEDNPDSTPLLRVDGGVTIGFKGDFIPIFDGALELPEGKTLTFRDRVWIRRVPSCEYTILPGTEVFLDYSIYETMKDRVTQAGGILCWASFNLPEASAENLISIPTGETNILFQSSTYIGDTPLLDSEKSVVSNAFNIAEGGQLTAEVRGAFRFESPLSGSGTVRFSSAGNGYTVNVTGNNSSFSGIFDLNLNGWNFCAYNPENLGTGATIRSNGESCSLTLGKSGVSIQQYPQNFEISGNPVIYINSDEVIVNALKIISENPELEIHHGTLSVKSSALACADSLAVNGDGTLKIDIDTPESLPKFTGRGNLTLDGTATLDIQILAAAFMGKISLGGQISFRTEALPGNPVLWLDASNKASCEKDDQNKVSKWRDCRQDLAGARPYAYLNQTVPNAKGGGYRTANPPCLFDDDTLDLGPVLDFGKQDSGCWFSFSQPITMRTAIFVIGSQNGGGASFFSYSKDTTQGIVRGGSIDQPIKQPIEPSAWLFTGEEWGNPLFKNARLRRNGVPVERSAGLSGGYDILTIRISDDQFLDTLAKDGRFLSGGQGDGSKRTGGMRYAELLFYDQELADSEVEKVEHYLMKKWMGGNPVTGSKMGSSADVSIDGNVTIDLTESSSLEKIPLLKGKGTLVKKGAGSLHLSRAEQFNGRVDWQGGGMRFGESLPEPAFWTDMAKADSFGTDENGRFYWRDRRWDGVTDYLVATQRWSKAPVVLENRLNGLPILDFGGLSQTHDRGLQWSRMVPARAVFMVIGSQDSGGTILGSSDDQGTLPFGRGDFKTASAPIVSKGYSASEVKDGLFRLDGKTVDGTATGFSGGYQVLVSYPTGPVNVGQFAHDREWQATCHRDGGQRLGEVLIFTNELSSAQILSVESYLQNKWIEGRQIRYGESGTIGKVELPTEGTFDLEKKGNMGVGVLTGSADIVADGKGTLSLDDTSSYSGTISVLSGTLALESAAERILKRSLFWVDAAKRDSVTFSAYTNEVVQWRDCRDNGIYARRSVSAESSVGDNVYPNLNPVLIDDELNGLPVMDFGEWMGNRFLYWSRDVKTIRTVFWVIGSQNGGGFLLGTSGQNEHDFFRGKGGPDGTSLDLVESDNPIWASGSTSSFVINGKTWLNGKKVNGTETGLSGGYDIVSLRTTGSVKASTFGIDCDRQQRNSTGGQRLAEVAIFDEELTDDETRAVEAYLSKKWGLPLSEDVPEIVEKESNMGILLFPGSSLALNRYGAYRIGSVGGIGEVTGKADLTLNRLEQVSIDSEGDALDFAGSVALADGGSWAVSLDGNPVAPIHVTGRFDLLGGGQITLTGAETIGDQPMVLLSAKEIEAPSINEWRVESDDSGRSFSVIKEGNELSLVSNALGLILILK